MKQQSWFGLLSLGVAVLSANVSLLCLADDDIADVLSRKYGINAVDKWLNVSNDELLRLQYKAVVHQMVLNEIFASDSNGFDSSRGTGTLAAARLYIDDMIEQLTEQEVDIDARRSRIAQAIVDLARLSLDSPLLSKTIETYQRSLRFIDVQSKQSAFFVVVVCLFFIHREQNSK